MHKTLFFSFQYYYNTINISLNLSCYIRQRFVRNINLLVVYVWVLYLWRCIQRHYKQINVCAQSIHKAQTLIKYNVIDFVQESAKSHSHLVHLGHSGLCGDERSLLHHSLSRGSPGFWGRGCGQYTFTGISADDSTYTAYHLIKYCPCVFYKPFLFDFSTNITVPFGTELYLNPTTYQVLGLKSFKMCVYKAKQ